MHCPVDNERLAITDRNGIEIDYCPACRGVWLDRGELDKIIDRAEPANQPQARESYPRERQYEDRDRPNRHDEHGYKKKKRESFLGELFDF